MTSNPHWVRVFLVWGGRISNQKWSLTLLPGEEDVYEIISHVAGGNRCLDVLEGSFGPGVTLDIFHCTTRNGLST